MRDNLRRYIRWDAILADAQAEAIRDFQRKVQQGQDPSTLLDPQLRDRVAKIADGIEQDWNDGLAEAIDEIVTQSEGEVGP